MKTEILRLFKGFLGEKSNSINEKALTYGLLIPATASLDVVETAIKLYGKDGVLWNQTFHKSWDKVANAPLMQLYLEQIIHYFTTYGFEALGCYDEATVYIPTEKLEVPAIEIEKIKLLAIVPLTEAEAAEKLMTLITSGIALSEQTVADIKVLSKLIDRERFDEVTNREVRTFLYDKYKVMPKDPEAFLRYLIFKVTGATLKIQNVATYRALQNADRAVVLQMLRAYGDYNKLSSIFLRNKNLFLALKTKTAIVEDATYIQVDKYHVKKVNKPATKANPAAAKVNTFINKLRKLAELNHKALKPALLDTLTSTSNYKAEDIKAALNKVTLFRAIRVLNSLAYRLNGKKDIVYNVRNGKSFVSKIDTQVANEEAMRMAYKTVKEYIIEKLSLQVKDKFVYIPEGLFYKAPASEKQFVGNIPAGSYFELPDGEDLIFAVHWNNLNGSKEVGGPWSGSSSGDRVDLDMHIMNQYAQFGWNTQYRDKNATVLFSGDVTSAPAPLGATEAYSFSHKIRNAAYLVTLNDFNGHNREVPFDFIVAKGIVKANFNRQSSSNYTIDPNTILNKFQMKIMPESRQITLGMIKANETTKRFYFNDRAIGVSGAVTQRDEFTLGALSYAETYNEVQILLNELLEKAGANIVKTPEVDTVVAKLIIDGKTGEPVLVKETVKLPVDIDLSVENITKESLIKLFIK